MTARTDAMPATNAKTVCRFILYSPRTRVGSEKGSDTNASLLQALLPEYLSILLAQTPLGPHAVFKTVRQLIDGYVTHTNQALTFIESIDRIDDQRFLYSFDLRVGQRA